MAKAKWEKKCIRTNYGLEERVNRAAFSLEGHDKGNRRGITVKIERNGGLRERLKGRL